MKALFNRFNRGLSKEKVKDKDPVQREKVPQLPPLQEWPPRSTPTPTSFATFKPLPDISFRPLPPIEEPSSSSSPASSTTPTPAAATSPLPPPPVVKDDPSPTIPHSPPQIAKTRSEQSRSDQDSSGRSSRKTNNGSVNTNHSTNTDVHKKVAFISPPPTPGPALDRAVNSASPPPQSTVAPSKTNVSRFQAAHGKDTRGSTSTATSSKTDIATTLKSTTPKPGSTRTATSPYPKPFDGTSIHQSLRSGTPYSQVTNASSRILSVQSWSEGAEEDLVSNLGSRERTRQEVLWEIVASEGRSVFIQSRSTSQSVADSPDRYVTELMKLRETFIDPLLHPYSTSPITSPSAMDFVEDYPRMESPRESLEHLPIAARFLSPLGFRSDSPSARANPTKRDDAHKDTPNIDGESMNSDEEDEAEDHMGKGYSASRMAAKHNHPCSPYGTTATRTAVPKPAPHLPFPSRSHQSLPPPPRVNPMTSSTHSLGRQSFVDSNPQGKPGSTTPSTGTRVLRKWKKSNPSPAEGIVVNGAVSLNQLPEDLRKCLEVIEGGILEGHMRLSEGLKKRYDEQYPLVRSLADVFVSNVSGLPFSMVVRILTPNLNVLAVAYTPRLCHLCASSRAST